MVSKRWFDIWHWLHHIDRLYFHTLRNSLHKPLPCPVFRHNLLLLSLYVVFTWVKMEVFKEKSLSWDVPLNPIGMNPAAEEQRSFYRGVSWKGKTCKEFRHKNLSMCQVELLHTVTLGHIDSTTTLKKFHLFGILPEQNLQSMLFAFQFAASGL